MCRLDSGIFWLARAHNNPCRLFCNLLTWRRQNVSGTWYFFFPLQLLMMYVIKLCTRTPHWSGCLIQLRAGLFKLTWVTERRWVWTTIMKWTGDQSSSSSSRQANGKLGKCLMEDICFGEGEDPRRVMSGMMEKFYGGRREGLRELIQWLKWTRVQSCTQQAS